MLAAILDRVEYLKDTLQELVKGDADEDDVQDQAFHLVRMDADAKAMVKEKIPERDRADAAGGEEMKKKKNKINYNFTKETCYRIAERDGNQMYFL